MNLEEKERKSYVSLGQHPYEHHKFVFMKFPSTEQKVVLDIGCGRGVWGFLIRNSARKLRSLIGIDVSRDYLLLAKKHASYDDLILASAGNLPLKQKSVNIVVAIEVVEHLSKREGYTLLKEIDRVTTDFALLTTPNGFLEVKTPSNIFEVHKSGWNPNELKSEGYQVFGMGLKMYQEKPSRITYLLECFREPLVWRLPQMSAFLLAVKKCK
ncbi:MAG: class I SAM-dependent methyltransferase [Candidatus Jordarchaeaceae archaeon]